MEDVIAVEECVRRVAALEAELHRAGSPTRRVPLVDLARAFIRAGDVLTTAAVNAPSGGAGAAAKRHIWLFSDVLVYGFQDADYGGWAVEKTVSLATMNLKTGPGSSAAALRNSFVLVTPEAELQLAGFTAPERDSWYASIEAAVNNATASDDSPGERIKKRLAVRPSSPSGGGVRGASPASTQAPATAGHALLPPHGAPPGGRGPQQFQPPPLQQQQQPPPAFPQPSFGPVSVAGLTLAGAPAPTRAQPSGFQPPPQQFGAAAAFPRPGMGIGAPAGPTLYTPPRPAGGVAPPAPSLYVAPVASLPPAYGAPPRR